MHGSWGHQFALVMMRDHPNAGFRSVVLDSSFPPEIPGFERFVTEAHEVVMQLFADCKLDPVCNDAYPNLKERFKVLLHAAEVAPIEGANVNFRARHLEMNHGELPYLAAETSPGVYAASGVGMGMGGDWRIAVDVILRGELPVTVFVEQTMVE